MTLQEAKSKYRGEWIAFKEFGKRKNSEGEVLLHSKNRKKFDKELIAKRMTGVYITFSGPVVKKGYTIIF